MSACGHTHYFLLDILLWQALVRYWTVLYLASVDIDKPFSGMGEQIYTHTNNKWTF